jgi:hypothetical protein
MKPADSRKKWLRRLEFRVDVELDTIFRQHSAFIDDDINHLRLSLAPPLQLLEHRHLAEF